MTVATAKNADGRLELFVKGGDNGIWHNRETSPGSDAWSGWASLGNGGAGTPNVGVNDDGRLEVFDINDQGNCWHCWQLTASGAWTTMNPMGGASILRPDAAVAVAANSDGSLVVFALDQTAGLWMDTQSGNWPGWSNLLKTSVLSNPAVIRTQDGLVRLFMLFVAPTNEFGTLANVGTLNQQVQSNNTSWTQVTVVGNPDAIQHLGTSHSRPCVEVDANGLIAVAVLDDDGQCWITTQSAVSSSSWKNWTFTGGGNFTGNPCIARNDDGRLELFTRGNDNALWHNWETSPGSGNWSGWGTLGNMGNGDPSVMIGSDGRLYVFWVNAAGNCWHIKQDPAGPNGWTAQVSLGKPTSTGLSP